MKIENSRIILPLSLIASGPARYNKNLMLGYGNFLKLKNKTCHFCKNATNKRKLSCESEFCSRVYCSRNNCLKKLKATYGEDFPFDDLYLENNMYDEKRFICPHCKDNTRCLSNYCKKKNRLMFSSELTSTQLERIRPPSEKWAGLLKAEERPALGSDGADRMAGCRRGGERKSFSPPNLARVGPPGGRQVRFEAPDLENISPPMSKFNLSLLGNL